jgi:hypothetical protein
MACVFASVSTISFGGHKFSAHKIHHADSHTFSTDGDKRTLTLLLVLPSHLLRYIFLDVS